MIAEDLPPPRIAHLLRSWRTAPHYHGGFPVLPAPESHRDHGGRAAAADTGQISPFQFRFSPPA